MEEPSTTFMLLCMVPAGLLALALNVAAAFGKVSDRLRHILAWTAGAVAAGIVILNLPAFFGYPAWLLESHQQSSLAVLLTTTAFVVGTYAINIQRVPK